MSGENDEGIRYSRRLQGDPPEVFSTPALRVREEAVRRLERVVDVNGENGAENRFTDDASVVSRKSRKTEASRASTAKTDAIRKKIGAELESMERLAKDEEDFLLAKLRFERKKQIEAKRLELEKLQIVDEGDEESDKLSQKLEDVYLGPKADSRESVEDWLHKKDQRTINMNIQPELPKVDPLMGMNFRLDRLLSRQSVPKELPIFSGDPEEWPMFKQQYDRTTKLCGLSSDENIARLQRCLKGKAREAVLPILGIPQNVPRVMETLELLFGRSDQIIRSMVAKVKACPAPTRSKPDSVILFSNMVANLVATMQNLNKLGHMSNPELLEQLILKLSVDQQFQWCQFSQTLTNEPSLRDFDWWLSGVAMTASLMPVSVNSIEKNVDGKRKEKKTLMVATENGGRKCFHCSAVGHKLEDCKGFLESDVQTRWKTVKSSRICFCCLNPGNRSSECRRKSVCGTEGCERTHNKLLHKTMSKPGEVSKSEENVGAKGGEWCGHVTPGGGRSEVLLRILPIQLSGPKGVLTAYAMMDEGSTITMMDSKVAKELGVEGPVEPLCIQWTNEQTQEQLDSQLVSVGVSGVREGQKKFQLHNVRTVKDLALPSQTVDMKMMRSKWKYLQDVPFDSMLNAKPLILIGSDNILVTTPRKVRQGHWKDPIATKTWLGWVVHGNHPMLARLDLPSNVHVCTQKSSDDELNRLVKQSFSTEAFGVRVVGEGSRSREDKRALEIMERTTRRVGDRFETGLLWKSDDVVLPDSRPNALRRLLCMERKMDQNPSFADAYCARIEDYVAKGYCRKLSPEEARRKGPRTYYIPHFAVLNENKGGKLRLVFDAASKSNGVSLNDCLLTAPDLLNPLPAILMRFRRHIIGDASDIKEMFHQILIIPDDVDSQRFLWRGKDRNGDPGEYVMLAMILGLVCSPSSAMYVKDLNAREFLSAFPSVADSAIKNTYMDDYLHGAKSSEAASMQIAETVELFRRGGFFICNWACSSREVVDSLPEELRSKKLVNLEEKDGLPVEKILGMRWDPERDEFLFELKFPKIKDEILTASKIPTKREMAALISSDYDPVGMVVHFTVKARIIFQEVWLSKTEWDEQISPELFKSWKWWIQELANIVRVRVPRCYSPNLGNVTNIQLHLFVDASGRAFASVAYLRIDYIGQISTAFVAARARVAPLKALSIPRLELQAAVMGCRLAETIKKEIEVPIHETFFWSDSMTVVSWIRSESRRFKQFVAHRLGEIQEASEVSDWRWIPTDQNVADEATRQDHDVNFDPDSRWYNGPKFLLKLESEWPKEKATLMHESEAEELKKEFVTVTSLKKPNRHVPNIERFSSWTKLVRTAAWVQRFAKNWSKMASLSGELSGEELTEAQLTWWEIVQESCFGEELKAIRNGKQIPKNSKLLCLSPFVDADGVLRIKGRLGRAEVLHVGAKHPIILDPRHRYTQLLLSHLHVQAAHQGVETVLNEVRLNYWVIGGRAAVKKAFYTCQWCRVKKARPSPPEMAELPVERLKKPDGPFSHTGVDFFGPYLVSILRKQVKRYGVLFTCLSTRAVHLEVAPDLSTAAAINAIRRFIARRTVPEVLWSDNGTNFHGADRELREAIREIDREKVSREVFGMVWRFNPPASPHMGGAWERMVKSVKVALGATLKGHVVKEDVLHTLFTEAEFIINNRPLTHVSVDPEVPESLTPNHFLRLGKICQNVPGEFGKGDWNLRCQWKLVQELAEQLWKRWVKEYLPTLTRRVKWCHYSPPIKVGDVVVVADKDAPRNSWPLGRVVAVYPGRDGQVRVVDVKTKDGTYKRPATKICVLDVRRGDEEKDLSSGGRTVDAAEGVVGEQS